MQQNIAKAALRAHLSQLREAVSSDVRRVSSGAICRYFFDSVNVLPGQMVSGFYPIGSEIDPLPLLAELRASRVLTCLPVTLGKDLPLIFRQFEGDEALVAAGYGSRAPDECAKQVTPDIVLMPLLGFDQAGNRLGYGGGYYDRTISAFKPRPLCVGVAFSCQQVDALPAEPHDIKMDMVLSETGTRDWR